MKKTRIALLISLAITTQFKAGAVELGNGAIATGNNSIAIGENSFVSGDNATGVGSNTNSHGLNSTAIGSSAGAFADNTTSVGGGSRATENGATSIGQNADATGENTTVIGKNANSGAYNGVSIGSSSSSNSDNSTSIGAGSSSNASMAEKQGLFTHFINPAYTSQECSICHYISTTNRTKQEEFTCRNPACANHKVKINADINAARVIKSRLLNKNLRVKLSKDNVYQCSRTKSINYKLVKNIVEDEYKIGVVTELLPNLHSRLKSKEDSVRNHTEAPSFRSV